MMKPDRSAFVVTYASLRRIRIYDRNENLRHDVFLEGGQGNYKVVPTRPSEQYWHFSWSVCNGQVYLFDKSESVGCGASASALQFVGFGLGGEFGN